MSCRRVGYAYLGRFPALEDVSLDVAAGECVALLGANGSGKSTLLKLLDGLVHPDRGQVRALGDPVTEDALADPAANARFRRRVGFVFQRSEAQLFSASVRDELAFGCRQLGLPASETATRVEDALDMLGLADVADRSPVHLSGGQAKRVALGSVLVMNPDVILLDEPTAALDPRTASWLVDMLGRLRDAGKTLVLATHDLALAEALADRCVVLGEDHRVLTDAPTGRVLSDRDLLLRANLVA